MKTLLISLVCLFTFVNCIPTGEDVNPVLEIGKKAPLVDNQMKDVSGKELSLKSEMKESGLLVIFSCNTCPFVIGKGDNSEGWEGRYNDVAAVAGKNGIGTILINSNEAKRDNGDGFEDMVARAKEYNYAMAYVEDKDHIMADAFGARTTPHVFLFNNKFELVYKGAIDDNNDSADEVEESWLKNALNNLAAGNTIDPNATRNIGCSIKRVKK